MFLIFLIFTCLLNVFSEELPTSYEYYTSDGISSGLSANQSYFTLNGKNITLYSGAMHYFRVPRAYWKDRLRKIRAAGLNTVETYVSWNLHEFEDGKFDFGNGGSDMEDFLNLEEFLETAKEEDLFVILRSGPYICAEWEFGGFPSWLLRNYNTKLRTSEETYMAYVTRYFNILLKNVSPYQFTKGGSIIMFQVENEYASTQTSNWKPDKDYLKQIEDLLVKNGIVELLVTADSAGNGYTGSLEEFLLTANFGSNPEFELDTLKKFQTDKPSMSMEFYAGWFDHWTEGHHTRDNEDFKNNYERILKYPASVNQYMFHGGTSFGFLNGANLGFATDNSQYQPDTNSYDYDAPISENGDYSDKYDIVKDLNEKYNPIKTKLPEKPTLKGRVAYESVQISEQILLSDIIDNSKGYTSKNVIPMELLPINNGSGQSYGYIVYRKTLDIPKNAVIKIGGRVCDTLLVLVNGELINKIPTSKHDIDGFGFWRLKDSEVALELSDNLKNATLDLIVNNMGRGNYGVLSQFNQYKGLWQDNVYLNGDVLDSWEIVPLEFKKSWTNSLSSWGEVKTTSKPALYRGRLEVTDLEKDTYIDMRKWKKGIVIVNGFVLSRHFFVGPQQTAYLPAPLLRNGTNEIIIFEEFQASNEIVFSAEPIFENQ